MPRFPSPIAAGLRAFVVVATALPLPCAGADAATSGTQVAARPAKGQGSTRPATPSNDRQAETGGGEAARYSYTASVEGVPPEAAEVTALIRTNATAFRLADDPPASPAGLRRRAEADVERIGQVLNSQGFYDPRIDWRIEPAGSSDQAARLVYELDLGTSYLLGEVLIETPRRTKPASANVLDRLGLHIGMVAEAEPILEAERRLVRHYRETGHPFAKAGTRRTVVDSDTTTMTVTFRIEPGAEAAFGDIVVDGLESVEREFVRRNVQFQKGEPFDVRLVEETRRKLMQTGLFTTADLSPVEPVNEAGEVDIRVEVAEREHRTVGAGVRFSTSEGLAGRLFWEHRNLFHEGERLRLGGTASTLEQGVDATFRKPLFNSRRQALVGEGEIKQLQTDAFEEKRGRAFIGVERDLGRNWFGVLGPTVELFDVTESNTQEGGFVLLGGRGTLRRDTTQDPLDPVEGHRLSLELTPQSSVVGDSLQFLSGTIAGSHYLGIDEADRFVIASRAKLGSIVGVDNDELPPGKRFYAGGGGSVRGYAFQEVGPLDKANEPVGGRSLLEVGLELRARITESIGVVPFVEGGNVYTDAYPETLDLLWAAGIGLRYYTPIGPARVDFAFPLERRSGIDEAFQFYISFGQAF